MIQVLLGDPDVPGDHADMRPSLMVLLVANAMPLLGSVFFGWSLGSILALYWAETAVIGVLAVVKILIVGSPWNATPLATRLFLAVSFCCHFGLFILVLAVFAGGIVEGGPGFGFEGGLLAPVRFLLSTLQYGAPLGEVALALLALSHGVSLVVNHLVGGERRCWTPKAAVLQPYRRVIVMHVVVLAGCMLAVVLRAPQVVVSVLVLVKTALDGCAHSVEHRRLAAGPSVADGGPAAGRVDSGLGP